MTVWHHRLTVCVNWRDAGRPAWCAPSPLAKRFDQPAGDRLKMPGDYLEAVATRR